MDFDYLVPTLPGALSTRGPAAHRAMREVEMRDRARLFKRLGYDQAYAIDRCMSKLAWGYEGLGKAPLTRKDVERLVAEGWR